MGYAGTEIHGPRVRVDVIGNTYRKGPDSFRDRRAIMIWSGNEGTRLFLNSNAGPGRADATGPEWDIVTLGQGSRSDYRAQQRLVTGSSLRPEGRRSAARAVLAAAGASEPKRDRVDSRIVRLASRGGGSLIDAPSEVGGFPQYGSARPRRDTDHDGMPNAWEISRGSDPTDPRDGARDPDGDGYTNLEDGSPHWSPDGLVA